MTAIEIVSLIVYAFDQADAVLQNPVTRAADDVAHTLAGIFGAVSAAKTGQVTSAEARAQIAALAAGIASNDAAADAALAAKFPKETP